MKLGAERLCFQDYVSRIAVPGFISISTYFDIKDRWLQAQNSIKKQLNLTKVRPIFTPMHKGSDNCVFKWTLILQILNFWKCWLKLQYLDILPVYKYWLHERVTWSPRSTVGFEGWQFPMFPSCAVNILIYIILILIMLIKYIV